MGSNKKKKKQQKELKEASRIFFARVYAVSQIGEMETKISPRKERTIKCQSFEAAKASAIKKMRRIHQDNLGQWYILYATVCSRDKAALLAKRKDIRQVERLRVETWGWTAETRFGGLHR